VRLGKVVRILSRNKVVRNRVDISDDELTRHWRKYFGTSKDKLEAAVAKVGDNPETVQKELRAQEG
jgi:ribosome biogenesis GTPase A